MQKFTRSKKFKMKQKELESANRQKTAERQKMRMESPEWKPRYSGTCRNTESQVRVNSGPTVSPAISKKPESKIDKDEYNMREEKARQIIDARKKTLAPAYNKGAYQPVLNIDDAKFIGRS